MISRYSKPEMAELFSERARWRYALRVELAACEEMQARGWIPAAEASRLIRKLKRIESEGGVDVEQVRREEAQVHHDVIAFVTVLVSKLGKEGRWVHFGLTSSDVLDTALALQLREAGALLLKALEALIETLRKRARETADLPCMGRTHGMHAEPTVFGLKFLGFAEEMCRNLARLEAALERLRVGKLSGAVGVYAHLDPRFEAGVMKRLGLKVEPVSTQVIPRDRHAEWVTTLAILGGGIERIATEIRGLQRSEVAELREGFARTQKGSSAMPHKRNPIASENLCGAARLLRGYALASLESIALWHERDISHSAVERVGLADAMILAHYAVERLDGVVARLEIDRDRIGKNLEGAGLKVYSGAILLELVQRGAERDEAYRWIQRCALEAGTDSEAFLKAMEADLRISKLIAPRELRQRLSAVHATRNARVIFKRARV
ncbi:MAG: adenylosuccinate lyase [Pseudomonadota bacterium]|jgi:adenylosuccinate lyase